MVCFNLDISKEISIEQLIPSIKAFALKNSCKQSKVDYVLHFTIANLDEWIKNLSQTSIEITEFEETFYSNKVLLKKHYWLKNRKTKDGKEEWSLKIILNDLDKNDSLFFSFQELNDQNQINEKLKEINAGFEIGQDLSVYKLANFNNTRIIYKEIKNLFLDVCELFPGDFYLNFNFKTSNVEDFDTLNKLGNLNNENLLKPIPSKIIEYLRSYYPKKLDLIRGSKKLKQILEEGSIGELLPGWLHRGENPFSEECILPRSDEKALQKWFQKSPFNDLENISEPKNLFNFTPQMLLKDVNANQYELGKYSNLYFRLHNWEGGHHNRKSIIDDIKKNGNNAIEKLNINELSYILCYKKELDQELDQELIELCVSQQELLQLMMQAQINFLNNIKS